jgi:hypothetical protein
MCGLQTERFRQLETKFLRVRTPVTIGSRFDDGEVRRKFLRLSVKGAPLVDCQHFCRITSGSTTLRARTPGGPTMLLTFLRVVYVAGTCQSSRKFPGGPYDWRAQPYQHLPSIHCSPWFQRLCSSAVLVRSRCSSRTIVWAAAFLKRCPIKRPRVKSHVMGSNFKSFTLRNTPRRIRLLVSPVNSSDGSRQQ